MRLTIILISALSILSCHSNESLDLVITGGTIYTASENSKTINAIGVKDGKIKMLGSVEDLLEKCSSNTQIVDASGMFVMPGLIEGHGHFYNMGKSLQNLNFLKDTSWEAIIDKVNLKAQTTEKGEWIYGRGWHQEKWMEQPQNHYGAYPKHNELSQVTPDNPVMLVHASGHSLFANEKAIELVGISSESPNPSGGNIVKDDHGNIVGVFEERAMESFIDAYQSYLESLDQEAQSKLWHHAIELAEETCLKNGITSFQDAGSTFKQLDRYKQLALDGELDIRLWAMLRQTSEEMTDKVHSYRNIDVGDYHFTSRAIKTEIDGALGSHGAWLIEPYEDKPEFYGQNTTTIEEVQKIAEQAYKNNMQLCVHAIGDRANKETLDIIEKYNTLSPGLRWRVEHAQHLNPNDINRFKSTGAIASMQAVHCTSDAPFVVKRLGTMRSKIGAYAWKQLLSQGVIIVNGTDAPVEDINPIENFFASVTRKRLDNGMAFFVEQRMSREEALKSYTINAAFGAFEEDIKGSIELGKLADFTILDQNLLTCTDDEIPRTNVVHTIVGGKVKYSINR